MDIRILGPFEVSVDGERVALGGVRQRAVLAALVLRAGEAVPLDRLIDDLWGERAPATAPHAVRVYVSQLRKALGGAAAALETRGRAYVLHVGPDELDLTRFERLLAAGRAALEARRPELAEERLAEALALWRGPALGDLAYEAFAQAAIARLDELHALALEDHVDAELELGRHEQLVPRLEALVREHAHRERLHGQLMLALYRCGRQADALDAYHRFHGRLDDELGIVPTRRLQDLQAAILRHDPALAPAQPPAGSSAGALDAGRAVVGVCLDEAQLDAVAAAVEALAASQPSAEAVLVRAVARDGTAGADLSGPLRPLEAWRAAAIARGVPARTAAFRSADPGADSVRLAAQLEADLLLVDAPATLVADGSLGPDARAVLAAAACDVALVLAAKPVTVDARRPLLVPFGGSEHDWAALELAARLASSRGTALRLLGVEDDAQGDDASRVLAGASLVLQRIVGIAAEPVLTSRDPSAMAAAAAGAGLLVVGLSTRWQADELGTARLELVRQAAIPTLLVRRGIRPGLFAPRESATRFTWAPTPGGRVS